MASVRPTNAPYRPHIQTCNADVYAHAATWAEVEQLREFAEMEGDRELLASIRKVKGLCNRDLDVTPDVAYARLRMRWENKRDRAQSIAPLPRRNELVNLQARDCVQRDAQG